MITRRSMLMAGAATLGFRRQPIRLALDPAAGELLAAGVRFGVDDAARATTLMGRSLALAQHADITITADAGIDVRGSRFAIRASQQDRDAAVRQATAAGVRPSQDLEAVEWHHSLSKFGASELNARFGRRTGRRMSAEHWLGWMAVKVVADASLRASADEALARAIARVRFDGHKGTALSFSSDTRRLRQPLYVVDVRRDAVTWPA